MNSIIENINKYIKEDRVINENYNQVNADINPSLILLDHVIHKYRLITEEEFEILNKELDEINNGLIINLNYVRTYKCGDYISNADFYYSLRVSFRLLIVDMLNNIYFLKFTIKFIYKFYGKLMLDDYIYKYLILKADQKITYNEKNYYNGEVYKKLMENNLLAEIIDEDYLKWVKMNVLEIKLKKEGIKNNEFSN